MIRHITALLFLVCLVPALMLGATNGKKYQDPVTANPDTSSPDAPKPEMLAYTSRGFSGESAS